MDKKMLHRIIGLAVFLITVITYFLTVQSSVSFWDCGEFIASSYLLQVPHPPGTPLFLILGRLFSMIPFAENIAFRVNAISVLSSAFTVLFLYLIAVKLIENFRSKDDNKLSDAVAVYIASAIGALSLAFADTFWFNAVEAEVYALTTFFIGFVVWLMMVWNEKADKKDNEKYLIFIAYLIGLATGVHLLSLLAIVPILMVIMFRKYMTDDEAIKSSGYLFIIHSAIILLIALIMWANQTGTVAPSQAESREFDSKSLLMFGAVSVFFVGIFWKKIIHKNSFYFPIALGGIALFAVYPGIVKYVPKLIASIGKDNIVLDIIILFAILGILIFLIYWTTKEKKETLNFVFKCFLFAFIGFTTYAMIIIRANQDTPINLNSPKTFQEVVSYLNRDQYGEAPVFKRRYSHEPHLQGMYSNYTSDLDFFLSYQVNHMVNRYLLWNYVGRASTKQDDGIDVSKYFAIPFLFGLLGLYFHFRKDWKMASVFLILFLMLGYIMAIYFNSQQPQPRERDYFYVGAFFVFSIWIALGVYGLVDLIKEKIKEPRKIRFVTTVILIITFVLIPFRMLWANYFEHDRSRNFVPWDYSYNILQSVAPNAIIFTNGDNDTFPLWYLQDVESVRRDVRVANLSLLNTDWYIKQLKNTEPHGTPKIKMSLSDQQIERIGPNQWKTRRIDIPIYPKTYEEFGIIDTSIINQGKISWNMEPTVNFGSVKAIRAQDIVAMDIVRSNMNERPVYFAVTTPDNSKIGLNDYLEMEGLAFRVVPRKSRDFSSAINPDILWGQLMNEPDGYSENYQPGFKFRGINDSTIFMDHNHERLTLNYRNSYIRLAIYYSYAEKNSEKVVQVLDMMEEKIPRKLNPIDYRLLNDIANRYIEAGAMDRYRELANEIEMDALKSIEDNPMNVSGDYNPYFVLKQIYDNLNEHSKFLEILQRLKKLLPNDPSVDKMINDYTRLANRNKLEVPQQNK